MPKYIQRIKNLLFLLTGLVFVLFIYAFWKIVPESLRADYLFHIYYYDDLIHKEEWLKLLQFVFANQSGHFIIFSKIVALFNYFVFNQSTLFSKIFGFGLALTLPLSLIYILKKQLGNTLTLAILAPILTAISINWNFLDIYIWTDAIPPHFGFQLFTVWFWYFYDKLLQGRVSKTNISLTIFLFFLALTTVGAGVTIIPAALLYFLFFQRNTKIASVIKNFKNHKMAATLGMLFLGVIVVQMAYGIYSAIYGNDVMHLRIISESLKTIGEHPKKLLSFFAYMTFSTFSFTYTEFEKYLGILSFILFFWIFKKTSQSNMSSQTKNIIYFWFFYGLTSIFTIFIVTATRYNYYLNYQIRYAIYPLQMWIFLLIASTLFVSYYLAKTQVSLKQTLLVIVVSAALLGIHIRSCWESHDNSIKEADYVTNSNDRLTHWNTLGAMRSTSAYEYIMRYYLEFMPRLKKENRALLITKDFTPAFDKDFLQSKGIDLKQAKHEQTHVCEPKGDWNMRYYDWDKQFDFQAWPPNLPLFRMSGIARDPLSCEEKYDVVFAVDKNEHFVCAGHIFRGFGGEYLDFEKTEAWNYKFIYDFSCPIPDKNMLPLTVYVFSTRTKSFYKLDSPAGS